MDLALESYGTGHSAKAAAQKRLVEWVIDPTAIVPLQCVIQRKYVYFISSAGDIGWYGSLAAPWRWVERAGRVAPQLKASNFKCSDMLLLGMLSAGQFVVNEWFLSMKSVGWEYGEELRSFKIFLKIAYAFLMFEMLHTWTLLWRR
jgi:hypothetical protein